MPDPIDRKAFVNLCEMSIDSMYELAALGELLEEKALITKQEIHSCFPENQPAPPCPLPPAFFFVEGASC